MVILRRAMLSRHEVGHHVQKLLGIEPKVRQMQQNASQAEVNRLSVRMELQADCFAGVWGHSMQQQGVLESGEPGRGTKRRTDALVTIACNSKDKDASYRTALLTEPLEQRLVQRALIAAIRDNVIPFGKGIKDTGRDVR